MRGAAYRIIEGKGATNLAIGLTTARILDCVAADERAVLPVSVRTTVEGVGEVCLSLPSVVGRDGVLTTLATPMDERRAGRAAGERVGDPRRARHGRRGQGSGLTVMMRPGSASTGM